MITPQLLIRIHPGLPFDVATAAALALNKAAVRFSITTARRLAHWLAQLAQESGFKPDAKENMAKYSAENLNTLWPARFPVALAQKVAGNAQAVGDIAYGGRMGNTAPHDGSLYVGRGPVQLTGKANYLKYQLLLGFPLVAQPDLVLEYGVGALVAAAYWSDHGCNRFADRGGVEMVETVTRAVNGGVNGLSARIAFYRVAAAALGVAA
ncbi:glycoside hydrolase family 19 protein [Deinococcus sp. UYEF24]